MAEDKHNFIVYTDWKKFTDNLSNEQAGIWIKWAIDYCSDLDPDLPQDQAIQMLIILCKDQFKKDLVKYYDRKDRMDKINENKRLRKQQETTPTQYRSDIVSDKCNMLNDKCNMLNVDDNSSNNIEGEELQIEIIKSFMQQLEELFNGKISPKNRDIAIKMCETYGSKTALNEIKRNIDKNNPINYANTILQNQNKEKVIVRKSKYLEEHFGKEE